MPPVYTKKDGIRNGVQRFKPDSKKYLCNIDTLWLNVNSYYYNDVMDAGLRDLLIEGRNAAYDGEDKSYIEVQLKGYENKLLFEIMPGNPPNYQYSIRNDDIAIYFSKNVREKNPSMRIQINQFILWEKGVENAYREALEVLKALGFLPYDIKLNRIDFAVHSDQFRWTYQDMGTFRYPRNIADDNQPDWKRLDPVTGEFGTYYHGDRSRCQIRIYNKSKEIEDKKKYYFYDLYLKHGMDIKNVWNIEFEVRRPFLKDLIKESDENKRLFDDFDYCLKNDGLSCLWSLLLERYNHNSAHWRMLHKFKNKHFLFNQKHGLSILKDIDANFSREVAQIAGRLQMAVLSDDDYSIGNALSKFIDEYTRQEEIRKKLGKDTWNDKIKKKKKKIHSYEINSTLLKNKKESSGNEDSL